MYGYGSYNGFGTPITQTLFPQQSENWAMRIIWDIDEGDWVCMDCGGIGHCDCLGDMSDPICDCGNPGYACTCSEDEDRVLDTVDLMLEVVSNG